MKQIFLFSLIVFSAACLSGQITIATNHLPNAGDTLVTRNAMFTSSVDMEETGEYHEWNFGFDVLEPLNLNPDVICYDVNNTPIAYQFLFNNPFDPAHNSDFALGVQQAGVAGVSFDNAFMYYKNHATKYTVTGMGAGINGIPLAAKMNEPDLLYKLPLNYGDEDSSHSVMNFDVPQLGSYGLDQYRWYVCDGWGTLHIWDESFEVLRVRSVVHAADSVFTGFINFGIHIPRPETITYEWLSTTYKEPILKVTTTAGVISQVQVADIYHPIAEVREVAGSKMAVYPNPADELLTIQIDSGTHTTIEVHDMTGRLVLSKIPTTLRSHLDVSSLDAGVYIISAHRDGRVLSKQFVKK